MEERISSLTIDGSGATSALAAIERGFEGVARSAGVAGGVIETVERQTTTRIRESNREWMAYERSIAGSTAALERFTAMSAAADRALASRRITDEQHAKALDDFRTKYLGAATAAETAAKSTRLASHEVTNLSYQLQDAATQLAGGQSPFLILAQQGPQATSAVGGVSRAISLLATPTAAAIAGTAALAGGFALVAARVADISAEARRLDVILSALNPKLAAGTSGDTMRRMAFDVAAQTGVSRADASASLEAASRNRRITDSGLVKDIAAVSQNMAAVLGEDAPKLASRLADAFGRGAAGVKALDAELGFLSPEMARTIRQMDEAGDRAGAMGKAMEALQGRFGGAAKGMESEWSRSMGELGKAWDAFMERIGRSDAAQAASGVARDVVRGVTRWLDAPPAEDPRASRMRELESQMGRLSGWLRTELDNGETGRAVDRAREQLQRLQSEYYGLAESIAAARKAQDEFSAGQSGRWTAGGWDTRATAPASPSPTATRPDGMTEDERKRIDLLTDAYEKERSAMAGTAAERGVRLAGLAAETAALERGATATAAHAEGLLAERRARDQLRTSIDDQLAAERDAVAVSERLAGARGGLTAVDRAGIEAQARYTEMLRSGATETQAAEGAALGYRKSIAGINEELAAMAERQRRDVDNTRLEFDLLGASNAERAKAVAMANAEYELRQRGVDLAKDEARTFVEQAGEVARVRSVLQDNARVAGEIGTTLASGLEAALSRGRGVAAALGEDLRRIALRTTVIKPFETAVTGLLTQVTTPPIAPADARAPSVAAELFSGRTRGDTPDRPVYVAFATLAGGAGADPVVSTIARSAANARVSNGRVTAFDETLMAAGFANGIDPATLYGVMMTESSGNPNAVGPVTSGGWRARGLMQFSPDTAKRFGIDPTDPEQSIWAAAEYLSDLKTRRGSINGALAGYGGFVTKDPSSYIARVQRFAADFSPTAPETPPPAPARATQGEPPPALAGSMRRAPAAAVQHLFGPGANAAYGGALNALGAALGQPALGVGGGVLAAGGPAGVMQSLNQLGGALGIGGVGGLGDLGKSVNGFMNQTLYGGVPTRLMDGIDDVGQLGYAAGTPVGGVTVGNAIGGAMNAIGAGVSFANGQYFAGAGGCPDEVPDELSDLYAALIMEAFEQ